MSLFALEALTASEINGSEIIGFTKASDHGGTGKFTLHTASGGASQRETC